MVSLATFIFRQWLMKESSGGISAAFVLTDFKALYGYIFL